MNPFRRRRPAPRPDPVMLAQVQAQFDRLRAETARASREHLDQLDRDARDRANARDLREQVGRALLLEVQRPDGPPVLHVGVLVAVDLRSEAEPHEPRLKVTVVALDAG